MKHRKIKFICLLILVIVITIFGITYYQRESKESPEMAKLRQFLVENCKEFEIPEVDTSDWKTFRDRKNGFKFKYPSGWAVEERDSTAWGFKEILSIRNPEDDEPCPSKKGCWDGSIGETVYHLKHDVVSFSFFSPENLKEKYSKIESANYNKPETALEDGVVAESFDTGARCGSRILIDHQDGFYSNYDNLESRSVEVGDVVKKDQEIGMICQSKTEIPNPDVDLIINSLKERLEEKGDILYGFIDDYIYIYYEYGTLNIFLNLNKTIVIHDSYSTKDKKEYLKIYYGVLQSLRFY